MVGPFPVAAVPTLAPFQSFAIIFPCITCLLTNDVRS